MHVISIHVDAYSCINHILCIDDAVWAW